ncbi:MAG: hypothetical protein KAH17_00505 [Bacteroidales bacterium]|nr:hypothetical protein [Bacteroidales bacterium]
MSCLFDFQYISIKATASDKHIQEWRDVAQQAAQFIEDSQHSKIVLQLIWFFESSKDVNWHNLHRSVGDLNEMQPLQSLTQTFIAQAPFGSSHVELIIRYLNKPVDHLDVSFKEAHGNRYTCIASGKNRWILIGGLSCHERVSQISDQAKCVFSDLKMILNTENLGFTNMVRQWNYIENIVGFSHQSEREFQHYQEFNEIRADWYYENGLSHDFPAATGIGTHGGGVIIEGIAARLDSTYKLLSIGNPKQEHAHSYSKAKLVGVKVSSAPLFERGKMICGNNEGYIWVSGTAAIRGEDSVLGDISDQTRITCENIDELITPSNLQKAGSSMIDYDIKPVYIRAYVKPGQDGFLVEDLLRQRYPDALVHILYADICRGELLVELEGEFRLS